MSWLGRSLGDSVSSLTGQLSNLTKDILTEGTEEVSDHATELSLAREQIINLESIQATQRIENDRLKRLVRELEEKAESAELQINSISRQYRIQLEEKEKEINLLKQRNHELLEHSAKEAAALHLAGDLPTSRHTQSTDRNSEYGGFQEGFDDWSSESWGDFDDSLRLQREINHLRQEVSRLHSDSHHWRSVAGQLSLQNGSELDQSASRDLLNLQAQVKELEKKVAESREQAQLEVASLQDIHQSKMSTLKKHHKKEVTQLQSQLASLEQQLAEAHDGASSGTGGSSSVLPESDRVESELEKTLRSQLAAFTQERDKAQNTQTHLQEEVEELQEEVESLQALLTAREEAVLTHQKHVELLQTKLEEAERWRVEAEQGRQEENQLKCSIAEAGRQLQKTSAEAEHLIEQLGSEEATQHTTALMDSLERDNLALKEQCLKLQEQVTLLERRSANQQEEWQRSQTTIRDLRQQLKQLQDGADDSSDNTLDQSITVPEGSGSLPKTQHTGTTSEDDSTDWEIQKEAIEQVLAQMRQELREKDEQISLLSRTDGRKEWKKKDQEREEERAGELASLREEVELLQCELSSVRGERDELETSIGELDEQHQEATSHLITARNSLQSQLADSQLQVKALQEELQKLSQQQQQQDIPDSSTADLADQLQQLRQELSTAQEEISSLRQQAHSREGELSELKQKLQKGTLALNDLHMDKKELEEEVEAQREEVKTKVATIKLLREEKSQLVEEKKRLQNRVDELEEEVESWEQRNEECQGVKTQLQQLRDQVAAQEEENTVQREKLDAMFAELDQSRTLCRKLQQGREEHEEVNIARQAVPKERDRAIQEKEAAVQERDRAIQEKEAAVQERDRAVQEQEAAVQERDRAVQEQEAAVQERDRAVQEQEAAVQERDRAVQEQEAAVQERDRAVQEQEAAVQERDRAIQEQETTVQERDRAFEDRDAALNERDQTAEMVSQLKKQLANMADPQQTISLLQRTQELEAQLKGLEQQVQVVAEEKQALQEEVLRLKEEMSDHDWDLKLCNQDISRALQRRGAALHKLIQVLDSQSNSPDSPVLDSQSNSPESPNLTGDSVAQLCRESCSLLDYLARSNLVLEEIQQQYYPGFEELVQSSASNLHTTQGLDARRAERETLQEVIRHRDTEILDLRQLVKDLQNENTLCQQSSSSLSESISELERLVSEKENELKILHTENNQLMKVCDDSKSKLAESDMKMTSLKAQLQETENALEQAEEELGTSRQTLEQVTEAGALHAEHKKELELAREKIQQLENELSEATEVLNSQKTGIEELNAKCFDQRRTLDKEQAKCSKQEDIIAVLRYTYITADKELEMVKQQLNKALKYLTEEQREGVLKSPDVTNSSMEVAQIYYHQPALEMKPSLHAPVEEVGVLNGEVQGSCGQSELSENHAMSKQHADLLKQLEEKDEIIADLQQNNTSLLQLLEAKSVISSSSRDSTQLEVHQLQSEVKALKVEKEQMLAVMNEKSREASSLKAEVMRLMNVVSAEKSALDKLQRDNHELMLRSTPPRDESLEDMTREAMHNLSRLVRDREVEIEALKQKNETLMAVLQEMNTGGDNKEGPNLATHFADKQNLEKQLAALQAEREQMVAFVNQKHAESVAYHAEIQRLAALRAGELQQFEQLQADYDKLRPQFEDKNQSLVKAQNDLINHRQKYAELEVKYGELLQKSNASETVDAASFHELRAEKERLANKQVELQQDLHSREEKLLATVEKLKEVGNSFADKDAEASALKKQVDSLHFQLQGLRSEAADLRQEKQAAEQRHTERREEDQALKDLNSRLTLSVREKEFEVATLQERVQKLTMMVAERQGEQTQVAQLLKEQEGASVLRSKLQQEVDQLTLTLKQKQQQVNEIHSENLRLKEKEQKLSRELDRLRTHLVHMEEGYTKEALEAEEREKSLRNRLAQAEEQLAATASQVQSASYQASQQVESLQQQLQTLAHQRDSAYMQVASLQEQSQQYATSLSNLQLVLEQFQREKESQIAAETERYQEDAQKLRERVMKLASELQQTKVELAEASDGLEAAARLSEQLDHKEEAIEALREEVHNRETALKNAEEEIHKLTSSKEAKVDRELMKNLLLGYFHTPDRNRMDAIHAIGSVLGFTQQDFHKIEESQGGGWITSLFGKGRTPGTPTTPVHQKSSAASPNQSFSQLFVKFLEVESTPPPAPVRLPAEEMAREVQQHHHHNKETVSLRQGIKPPPFNPFTAPRHVAMPIAVGTAAMAASASSHLLMTPPPSSPTTTFPVFAPFSSPSVVSSSSSTSQSSSAILKDVLGCR